MAPRSFRPVKMGTERPFNGTVQENAMSPPGNCRCDTCLLFDYLSELPLPILLHSRCQWCSRGLPSGVPRGWETL